MDPIEDLMDEIGVSSKKEPEGVDDLMGELGLSDVKKKDPSEPDGVSNLETISSEFQEPKEEAYQNLQSASGVTNDQLQQIEGDLEDKAQNEYGFMGGPVGKERQTATEMIRGVRLSPSRSENITKNKAALEQEFSKEFNVPVEQIDPQELEIFYVDKTRSELVSKQQSENREDYISNLSDEDKDALEESVKDIKHQKLLETNRDKIISADQDLKQAKELVTDLVDTPENPAWVQRAKSASLVKRANQSYNEVASNTEDLGTINEELGLLKRNYGVLDNFLGKAFVSTGELFLGVKGAIDDILPEADPTTMAAKMIGLIDVWDDELDLSEQVQSFNKEVNEGGYAAIQEMRENIRETKSVSEISNLYELGEWVMDIGAEQLPNTVALLGSGGTSGLVLLASSAYGNKLSQIEREEDLGLAKYTPFQKRVTSFVVAMAEFFFEKASLGILNKAKRTFTTSVKTGAARELKQGMVDAFKGKLGKEVLKDANKEGVTEVLTQISENAADIYILGKEDVNIYDNAIDVYAAGAVLGGVLYKAPQIGAAIIKPFVPKDSQQKIGENLIKINELTKGIEALPESTQKIVEEQVAVLDAKNEKILKGTTELIDNLDVAQIKKVLSSEKGMFELRKQYKEVKDDQTLNPEQKEIILSDLNNNYKEISKDKNQIISDSQHEVKIKEENPELLTKVEEETPKPEKPKEKDAKVREEKGVKQEPKSEVDVNKGKQRERKDDNAKKDIGEGKVDLLKPSKEQPLTSIEEISKIDISDSVGLNKFITNLQGVSDTLKKQGKGTLGMNMPLIVAQGSVDAILLAAKTAKTGVDALSAGINYVKQTDWYKGLSDKEKVDVEKNLGKIIDDSVKPKKAETVGEVREEISKDVKPILETKEVKEEKSFEEPDQSKFEKVFDNFRIKSQDKLYGVRKLQRQIEKQKGFKQEKIQSDFDKAETLMHGKAGEDLELLESKTTQISKDIGKSKFTVDKVSDYMYAKHAEERNKHIKENVDSEKESGSGMTEKQATEILDGYTPKQRQELDKLTKPLYDLIEDTRKNLEKYGLMSKQDVDGLRGFYDNYVPLQGFAVDEKEGSEVLNTGGGSSLSVKGKEFKSATGRKTKAGDIVSQIIAQNANSLIRGRKNEVMQTLHTLVKENPNKDVWRTFSEDNIPTKTIIVKGKPRQQQINVEGNKDFVGLKIDGKKHYVEFGNKRLARSINAANIQKAGVLTKTVGALNRYLSTTMTTLNPEFVISNFTRDIQTALYNQMSESDIAYNSLKGKTFVTNTIKAVPSSIRTIYRNEQGKFVKNKELNKYYQEFKEDGAKTAWFYAKKPEQLKKDIDNIIKLETSKGVGTVAKKGFKSLGDFIDNANTAVENGVRLASYVEARKAGVERTDAAKYAKELTVNFNRSGEYGQLLNTLYLFFNASIQGSARFAHSMTKLKRNVDESGNVSYGLNKAQKLAAGMTVFSGLLTVLNQAMSDDDEDGESFYSKIPDYVKERNMVIMNPLNGEDYFTIPLPYGFNIFNNIGTMTAEVSSGERSAGDAIGFLTNSIVGSFAPLPLATSDTAEKSLLKSAVPTILKPILELAVNESYFNSRIYNTNFPGSVPIPESELGRRTTPAAFKNISKFLNEATGGSRFRSGGVDVNPDKIRYLFDFAIGGVGKFVGNTLETTENLIKKSQGIEDELPTGKIPFVRKVYGEPTKYVNQNKYYERKDEIGQLYKEYKEGDIDKSDKLYRGVVKLKNTLKTTGKVMKILRKRRDSASRIEDPIRKSQKLNEIERKYYKQIAKFNKEYNKLREDK